MVVEFEVAPDGCGASVCLAALGDSWIHLGTILSALETVRPNRAAGADGAARQLARLLSDNLERFVAMPVDLHGDCVALRYWHAFEWRSRWGTTIAMSSQQVREERERLARIQRFFVVPVNRLP